MAKQLERLEAPVGMDSETPRSSLSRGYAEYLMNVLPGQSSKAVVRGALSDSGGLFNPTPYTRPTAVWVNRADAAMVRSGGLLYVAPSALVGAPVELTASTAQLISGKGQQVGLFVYGWNNNTMQDLYRWDGTATLPAVYTNGPKGGGRLAYWLNRLWVAGGYPPGGGALQRDGVFWSDPFAPDDSLPDTPAAWQDDASGLTNRLTVPYANTGTWARIGRNLALFTAYDITLLVGSSPSDLTVRTAVQGIGSTQPDSFVEYDDVVYFCAADGYYRFDGVSVEKLTRAIDSDFRATIRGALSGISACRVTREYLAVCGTDEVWLFHVPTGTWGRFDSSAAELLSWVGNGASALLYDGGYFFQLNGIVDPDVSSLEQRPSDGLWFPIYAEIRTRAARLANPAARAQLTRLFVDHRSYVGGAPAPVPANWGWSVLLRNGDDNQVMAERRVTSDGSLGPLRKRTQLDVFVEADEVGAIIKFRGLEGADTQFNEFHDLYLEYQAAQEGASF